MGRFTDSKTRVTLLGRLGRDEIDASAWSEFVDRYGRKIYIWCRAWGLQEADAQDVTQIVLLKMVTRLRDFQYDPRRSFRAWLKTVTHHAWQDHLRARNRLMERNGDSGIVDRLAAVEARDDLSRRLEEVLDRELLEEAMARVRLRIEPRTWEAFSLLALENIPGIEAAHRLGMKVATVFVARSKVLRMLREEVTRLGHD